MAISYCSHEQEEIIRKAAVEAEQALTRALSSLKFLQARFSPDYELPDANEVSNEEEDKRRCILQTYIAFWDVVLLLYNFSEKSKVAAYKTVSKLVEDIEDHLLPKLRASSPVIEVTCGDSWSLKSRSVGPLPPEVFRRMEAEAAELGGKVEYFERHSIYDNRTSIAPDTPVEDRYNLWGTGVETNELFTYNFPAAGLWTQGVPPLTDVLALNTSYFRGWSSPSKIMRSMRGMTSLNDINTRKMNSQPQASSEGELSPLGHAVGIYRLQDLVRRSLTGVLIYTYPWMHSLAGEEIPDHSDLWQRVDKEWRPLKGWTGITSYTHVTKLTYLSEPKFPDQFAYLVMALYLNEWQWTTGVNTIPGQTRFSSSKTLLRVYESDSELSDEDEEEEKERVRVG